MFENWKAAREKSRRERAIVAEQAQRQHAQQRYQEQLQNWQDERDDLLHQIDVVQHFRGEPAVEGFLLKKDERAFGIIEGAALIEPYRAPGHFEAGSQGMSFRVAKGVTNRQKTSGFGYGSAAAAEVQFRLELALAVHNDTVSSLLQKCGAELSDQARLQPLRPRPRR